MYRLVQKDLNRGFADPALRAEHERLGKRLDELAVLMAAPSADTDASPHASWIDARTGKEVCVLQPHQRLADRVSLPGEPLSLAKYLRGLGTGHWDGADAEHAAMTEGSMPGGGNLVPSPLAAGILDKARNSSVCFAAGAQTVIMDSQTLAIAKILTDPTAGWHSEAGAITATDMTFSRVLLTAQTLVAILQASIELFEDAAGLDAAVSDVIARALALELDRAAFAGSGSAPEPKGIRSQTDVIIDSTTFGTNGSVISASAPAAGPAWDWLAKQVSALWGVNEQPTAAIYSARTAGELDLLRASTGVVLPPPESVANLKRLFTNSIINTRTQGTSNDCSEAYVGDFSKLLFGMRTELVLEVSRVANVGATSMFSTMQIAIRAYLRADVQLARAGAFRVVQGIR